MTVFFEKRGDEIVPTNATYKATEQYLDDEDREKIVALKVVLHMG